MMRLLFQMIHDRTMAVNSSFVPTCRRVGTLDCWRGKMKAVSWNSETRVFMWDNENCPFRPSKLLSLNGEDGYRALIGDEGGFLERKIKIGGAAQSDAVAAVSLSASGIDDSFLSTVLKEFHLATIVTPHCLCCMKVRSESGHWFCDSCNDPHHLSCHYFPHGGNVSPCCLEVDTDVALCCGDCVGHVDLLSFGDLSVSRTYRFSGGPHANLPVLPVEVIAKVLEYMFVPCVVSQFVGEWFKVGRHGSRLMLTVNFNQKFVYERCPRYQTRRMFASTSWKNPDCLYFPMVDRIRIDEDDENYISDVYCRKTARSSDANVLLLNEDPMFPSGVRSTDAQSLPVFIDVELYVNTDDNNDDDATDDAMSDLDITE